MRHLGRPKLCRAPQRAPGLPTQRRARFGSAGRALLGACRAPAPPASAGLSARNRIPEATPIAPHSPVRTGHWQGRQGQPPRLSRTCPRLAAGINLWRHHDQVRAGKLDDLAQLVEQGLRVFERIALFGLGCVNGAAALPGVLCLPIDTQVEPRAPIHKFARFGNLPTPLLAASLLLHCVLPHCGRDGPPLLTPYFPLRVSSPGNFSRPARGGTQPSSGRRACRGHDTNFVDAAGEG
jgi:hypothetical protein